MSADYTRISFNVNSNLLEVIDQYVGPDGRGRSALLNYLLASALANKSVVEVLDSRRKDK